MAVGGDEGGEVTLSAGRRLFFQPIFGIGAADELDRYTIGQQSCSIYVPTASVSRVRNRYSGLSGSRDKLSIRLIKTSKCSVGRKIVKLARGSVPGEFNTLYAARGALKDHLVKSVSNSGLAFWIQVAVVLFLNLSTQVQHHAAFRYERVQELYCRQATINRSIGLSSVRNDWDVSVDHAPHYSAASCFIRFRRAFSAA